ncbi:hypothetical protein MTsPCn9_05030 [Croceitalea sp. MTPC9]|uniref:BfmA/BtgA family mobilization protein n=1 Tax=unclassified Croceitalea TaxID=2632280 RepID=UPI002B36EE87|nr:hypothetical protein MTsPCn6_03680 [Croceitalea sp. MTPC6]GMN15567.1 hypothetical protein MTsPCn9_05030 [Croceitalea sp. MTPC9]
MDKGYENERFESLKIKTSVAKRFRAFGKSLSKSQSMTLLVMLDFFEDNSISPTDELGADFQSVEIRVSNLIKKRMNGMIAIIKNIEKNQTKPTLAMLQSLFEQTEPPKKKEVLFREKKYVNDK